MNFFYLRGIFYMVVFEVSGILKDQHGIFPANYFLKWGEGAWPGRAKKTVDFAMRDLRTVTCVL